MGALWVAKGPRFLQEENFDGHSMGTKGPRFLQEENFGGHSMGSQGSKASSGGIL